MELPLDDASIKISNNLNNLIFLFKEYLEYFIKESMVVNKNH